MTEKRILVGNTFSVTLVRRPVRIEPADETDFQKALTGAELYSYWGHNNTLQAANSFAGVDFTPKTERPAIRLNENGYPELYGAEFHDCWVFSPVYREGFRPAIGVEIGVEDIINWQYLHITWE